MKISGFAVYTLRYVNLKLSVNTSICIKFVTKKQFLCKIMTDQIP